MVAFLSIIPVVPPQLLGWDKIYKDQVTGAERKVLRVSILRAILHLFTNIINGAVIDLSVLFNFKTVVTLIIFISIGVDLFMRKFLSREAITLAAIGILVLYLELLLEKAKKITVWKFFEWEAKK